TSAPQKLPGNWEDLCEKAFFRMAHTIKEHNIPPSLIVNLDQMGIVYAPGDGLMWAKKGLKHVPVVGKEEKWVFTLVVVLANNGNLPGFQIIYAGSSKRSRPAEDMRGYQKLVERGCQGFL
ncbi:hypothetical protein K438DRAFT_1596050, partial [Mycena galopus ATCC 62051]